ncbi:hypothetical protein GF325_07635 [Candidatus Bathyarchaeota archaeon]|nr:hypothetical protein [Candidatus Bathyarchaeota archaeon]
MVLNSFIEDNLVYIIIGLSAWIAIDVILGLLVARDARIHGKKPGTWFLAIFFLSFVGLSIYLQKRRSIHAEAIKIGVVLSRMATGIMLALMFIAYFVYPLFAISRGIIAGFQAWSSISIAIAYVVIFGILAFAGASNRVGSIASFATVAIGLFAVWEFFYQDSFGTLAPALDVLKWILLAIVLIGGFTGLFNFFSMFFSDKNKYPRRGEYANFLKQKTKQHKALLLVVIPLMVATGILAPISTLPSTFHRTFTIQPKDYQAEFAFWATLDYNAYNTSEKWEMDKYNVTLVIYHPPNVTDAGGLATFVNNLELWKNNYPNVKFVLSVQGITKIRDTNNTEYNYFYNTFPWDGSADGVIYWSKALLNATVDNNLTNVIGLNVDIEKPDEDLVEYGVDITPNKERHWEAVQLYNEFLEWFRINHPGMIYTATMGRVPIVDPFDGDWDLHVYDMSNSLNVDEWDEIAPMIYRCSCDGTPPYGDLPRSEPEDRGRSNSYIYHQLKFLNKSLTMVDGDNDRIGIYLGITNCSCYGADREQYDALGNFAGYGFDQLMIDSKIAKHFGCKTITYFMLNTANSSNDPQEAHVMGGMFESYGIKCLEIMNETLNGENATDPIEIIIEPELGILRDFYQDWLINLGRMPGILVLILIMVGSTILSILLHPGVKSALKKKLGMSVQQRSR